MKQQKNQLQNDKLDDEQYEKLRKHLLEKSSSKLYALWTNPKKNKECKQIQANTKCFCDHDYKNHEYLNPQDKSKVHCKVKNCPCRNYSYVPSQGNLDFKCNCKHSHKLHDPISRRCTFLNCGACNRGFQTNYVCPQCNAAFSEHVLVFESRKERQQQGKKINDNEDTFNYEQFNLEYKSQNSSKSSQGNVVQFETDDFIKIEENIEPENSNLYINSDEPINDAEIERRKALPKQLHMYNEKGKFVKSGLAPQDITNNEDTTRSDKIKIKKDWNINTITIEESGQQINVKKYFDQQMQEEQNSKLNYLKKEKHEEYLKIQKKKNILKQLNQQIQEDNKALQQKYGYKPIDDENEIIEALQDNYIEEDEDIIGGMSAFYLFHLPNKYGLEIKKNILHKEILDKLVEEY
ncbi:hypothetical protein ABPG74_006318 [Tetrahymena malaccensis]